MGAETRQVGIPKRPNKRVRLPRIQPYWCYRSVVIRERSHSLHTKAMYTVFPCQPARRSAGRYRCFRCQSSKGGCRCLCESKRTSESPHDKDGAQPSIIQQEECGAREGSSRSSVRSHAVMLVCNLALCDAKLLDSDLGRATQGITVW